MNPIRAALLALAQHAGYRSLTIGAEGHSARGDRVRAPAGGALLRRAVVLSPRRRTSLAPAGPATSAGTGARTRG